MILSEELVKEKLEKGKDLIFLGHPIMEYETMDELRACLVIAQEELDHVRWLRNRRIVMDELVRNIQR